LFRKSYRPQPTGGVVGRGFGSRAGEKNATIVDQRRAEDAAKESCAVSRSMVAIGWKRNGPCREWGVEKVKSQPGAGYLLEEANPDILTPDSEATAERAGLWEKNAFFIFSRTEF